MQSGTYGLYVDGIRDRSISFAATGAWHGAYTNVSVSPSSLIPTGSVIELRRDKNNAGWNIDKFELQGTPVVAITNLGDQASITWVGSGYILQESTNLINPSGWNIVPGGTNSPVTLPVSQSVGFFRVLQL